MKRLLLIVDPQNDFISGTLPVPGAAEKMEALANYIRETDGEYEFKVVTTDWHPYHHCSFAANGGEWPMHCVQNTAGAAICQILIKPLFTTKGEVTVLRKGTSEDADEYSIFKNTITASKESTSAALPETCACSTLSATASKDTEQPCSAC